MGAALLTFAPVQMVRQAHFAPLVVQRITDL
jgi:hypothetical protein